MYEEYAALDAKIKELKAEKDALNERIIEDMLSREEDKADTSVGKFKIAMLKTWTYSDKVTELKEEYEARKAEEESTGEASFVEKPSLRFSQIKL